MNNKERSFKPLNIAVLTISDTRKEADDKSGKLLCDRLTSAGHNLREKIIVPDDIYKILENRFGTSGHKEKASRKT